VDLCSKFYFNSKIYLVRHIEFSGDLLRFEAEEEQSFRSPQHYKRDYVLDVLQEAAEQ